MLSANSQLQSHLEHIIELIQGKSPATAFAAPPDTERILLRRALAAAQEQVDFETPLAGVDLAEQIGIDIAVLRSSVMFLEEQGWAHRHAYSGG